MNPTIDLNKNEYIDYFLSLDCKETKKHVASQFLGFSTIFAKIEKKQEDNEAHMKDIKTELTSEKSYERYKKNKENYKKEIEDDIIKKANLLNSLKNISITVFSIVSLVYILFGK